MTRLTIPLCKKASAVKYKFKEVLPLELRDRVSGKTGATKEVSCLPEIQALLYCLKENSFHQTMCSKEITTFQNCYVNHLKTSRDRKETKSNQVLTPGLKTDQLSGDQATLLLKRYPMPKAKKNGHLLKP